MDINLHNDDCEFFISTTGILKIRLIESKQVIGNINLYLDDNDLMGLYNIIKNYFKEK